MKFKVVLKKPMVQFVILSHIIFWFWLAIIGFGMMRGRFTILLASDANHGCLVVDLCLCNFIW